MLIAKYKILYKIELGFLMVGHTHEDIDQFFSKLSQYLKHTHAHTLPGIKLLVHFLFVLCVYLL